METQNASITKDYTTMIDDDYHGLSESEVSFTIDYFNEVYAHEVPECITWYIDYEKLSYDMFISDFMSIHADDGYHIFSKH